MIEGVVAGVDIGGTKAKVGLVDKDGKVIIKRSVTTGMETTATEVTTSCREALESIQKKVRLKAQAVGIGCAGIVEHDTGVIINSPNIPKLGGKNLARLFERETGLPATVENDANVFGFAECSRGLARKATTAVFVTLGTGVGGAIIHNGRLIRGERGFAGEIGHFPIDPSGPVCTCGNRGCLESFVGAVGIVSRAREALASSNRDSILRGRKLTPKVIWDASRNRDSMARGVVKSTGYYLGLGLAAIVNLIDPGVIVLGGGIGSVRNDLFLSSARSTMSEHVMTSEKRDTRIVRAVLGPDAGMIGASLLARSLR